MVIRTQSSLLIPEKFLDILTEKSKGKTEIYFRKLMNRYKCLIMYGLLEKSNRVKISYQEKDQNLVKINFRPFNEDWAELGLIANYLGISRTALFTWFLILDFAGWDEILPKNFFENGVPPQISTIALKILLSRADETIWYRKIYYSHP